MSGKRKVANAPMESGNEPDAKRRRGSPVSTFEFDMTRKRRGCVHSIQTICGDLRLLRRAPHSGTSPLGRARNHADKFSRLERSASKNQSLSRMRAHEDHWLTGCNAVRLADVRRSVGCRGRGKKSHGGRAAAPREAEKPQR
jgi:hypothetical protein